MTTQYNLGWGRNYFLTRFFFTFQIYIYIYIYEDLNIHILWQNMLILY